MITGLSRGRGMLPICKHPPTHGMRSDATVACYSVAGHPRCPILTCLQAGAVPQADEWAMQEINERPAFPNRWPVEFGLLLKRAWKQQSRDRLPQARRCAPEKHALGWVQACSWHGGFAGLHQPEHRAASCSSAADDYAHADTCPGVRAGCTFFRHPDDSSRRAG